MQLDRVYMLNINKTGQSNSFKMRKLAFGGEKTLIFSLFFFVLGCNLIRMISRSLYYVYCLVYRGKYACRPTYCSSRFAWCPPRYNTKTTKLESDFFFPSSFIAISFCDISPGMHLRTF